MGHKIYVMLLTHAKLAQFTPKPVVDARKYASAIHCLSVDDKADVAAMSEKALKAGGHEPAPEQDYGFMLQRSFEDPDGHHWEVIWMDPAHVQ
jgi:predicted lactoylglutathione lyase